MYIFNDSFDKYIILNTIIEFDQIRKLSSSTISNGVCIPLIITRKSISSSKNEIISHRNDFFNHKSILVNSENEYNIEKSIENTLNLI